MSKEDTIINPQYAYGNNPGFFSFDDFYYIILIGDYAYKIDKLTKEFQPYSYLLYQLEFQVPYLWMSDEENNIYLFSVNHLYMFKFLGDNPFEHIMMLPQEMLSGYLSGYIKETEFKKESPVKNCECDVEKNEIVIYGITYEDDYETFISFFFKNQEKILSISDESFQGVESYISCNKVSIGQYLCAFENNQTVKIILIRHYWVSGNNCSIDIYKKSNLDKFTTYINVKIYDTLIPEKKMICANSENSKFECLFVTTTIDISCSSECSYSANFEITDIKISIELETQYDECGFCNNIFDEEGLICCGSQDIIKCTRLIRTNNEYLPKNSFEMCIYSL